ncbi:tetratricopeptide repeat protein [Rhodobacterales bacterium LSUCC1028]|nr:tetratricopeptide repeat protein [Rhodobacterales bacterium FZCC0069]MBF9028293.1 tetratricopeptide repeat protein [Rhodobacterales bacterium FZCC0188]MBF9053643.1 tetratricopeptide repeat protein [Rhodobacterales bacterium LSUCC1028]
MLSELQSPVLPDWERVEAEILNLWSRSGSPAMDLLLRRGRQAMARGDYSAALTHLTALTDHAPEFAEGWNARATLFYEMGDYGPSLDDIARTLALNPNHFGALTGLGMIMEQVEAYSHALDAFRAARAIHPHRPDLEQAVERLERQLEGISL